MAETKIFFLKVYRMKSTKVPKQDSKNLLNEQCPFDLLYNMQYKYIVVTYHIRFKNVTHISVGRKTMTSLLTSVSTLQVVLYYHDIFLFLTIFQSVLKSPNHVRGLWQRIMSLLPVPKLKIITKTYFNNTVCFLIYQVVISVLVT